MYEEYTKQALPEKGYRELLGSAICVFNSNNSFVIENILKIDNKNYNWYELIDFTSGDLQEPIKKTITKKTTTEIANLFSNIVTKRNRIVHSYQVTRTHGDKKEQILCTKDKKNRQFYIDEKYLLDFIKENETFSSKLYELRKTLI